MTGQLNPGQTIARYLDSEAGAFETADDARRDGRIILDDDYMMMTVFHPSSMPQRGSRSRRNLRSRNTSARSFTESCLTH